MKVEPNIIADADSYKLTHHLQYPKKTETIYSYLESRSKKHEDFTIFYGLQMFLMEYLEGEVVTQEKLDEVIADAEGEFGHQYVNVEGWQHIIDEHKGRLPLRIKAAPEGMKVPKRNVLMTIENTDPKTPWLTNYVETLMLEVWSSITVATNSWKLRELIDTYAQKSGTRVTPFHVHDFGFRGVSSLQSAGYAGSAHLVNFLGSDTRIGRRYAQTFYKAKNDVSASVFAAEHSTVTMYGKDNEFDAYDAIIDKIPDGKVGSIVSDSYNHWNAVENYFCGRGKDKILARNGKVVVRPDSGNPVDVSDRTLNMLEKAYGVTVNEKGFKTLNPKIGMIYGDRISYEMINDVLTRIVDRRKFTTDNIIFGMGGNLTQNVNRDTYAFAFKSSAALVSGHWRDVFKNPATDINKVSKKGRLKLVFDENLGKFMTVNEDAAGKDLLTTVFEDGKITKKYTFAEIRKRAGWNDYYT